MALMEKKRKAYHFKFFQYVNDTPIIPIQHRILTVFILFLLLTSFATNLISLMLLQSRVVDLTNKLLINQLTDIYTTAGNQFQISLFSGDTRAPLEAIKLSAENTFSMPQSMAVGVRPDGSVLFYACADLSPDWDAFTDEGALLSMASAGDGQGTLNFTSPYGREYHGVFKFQDEWEAYIIRAESISDTNVAFYRVFGIISLVIFIVTVICLLFGLGIISRLLSNIRKFTKQIYDMQSEQSLGQIDISSAPNDDITYLAANFNMLTSRVNYLMGTFQKFVPETVVKAARKEEQISLRQGRPLDLTILFSDIRGFTFRTEVLGTDIIDLLNVHYNSVIERVKQRGGEIGSIIGDAILVSYGQDPSVRTNKSLDAIDTAWDITFVTERLRESISHVQEKRSEENKPLSESESRVLDAALLDVGVGIDGGTVYYGNVGSESRMQSTFIGDNVNSASRLEGLTRFYNVPVIVSAYVMDEALKEPRAAEDYEFFEIDTVQVKGKTEGVKIYLPLKRSIPEFEDLKQKMSVFEQGLSLYYKGSWSEARRLFKDSDLALSSVFLERMGRKGAPENWSGIWTMTTK